MKPDKRFQFTPSIFSLFLMIFTLLLVSCNTTQASPPAAPAAPERVSVQFSWVDTIEFVGFYEALRQGYYSDVSLDVSLAKGGFDESGAYIDPVKQVVEGKSEFGVAGADVLLTARSTGQPVVAIAAIYQRSPVVLISLSEKNIIRPQDLAGQRVDTEPGTTVDVTYRAMLASQNVDDSEIIESPRTDFTVAPLFNDETDVLSGFITNDGVQAKLRSEPVNFLLPSDYGIDIYSNTIFTTEEMIKNKPEAVAAFVEATIKGMRWAIDHPEDAAQHVIDEYGQDMPLDISESQQPGMVASLPLINPAGSQPGMMTAENWETTYEILRDQELLSSSFDVSEAYTLDFLQKVYSQ